MSGLKPPSRSHPGIRSVDKAFDILQAIVASDEPLRLAEISRSTGLARNLAHVYLISLQRVGAVTHDAKTGRYELGRTSLQMGLAALTRLDFLAIARRYMQRLRDEVGESVWLSVWSERGPVVIAKVDGLHASPFEIRIGSVVNMSVSATGRTFIAHIAPAVWKPLVKRERARITAYAPSEAELALLLKKIRRQGVASRPEVDAATDSVLRQFAAIAAPVFDHTGSIKAAVTVIGLSGTFDVSPAGTNAIALKAIAMRLSAELGYASKIAA